jgi:diguanylate cyclase (GGDEF)-like protein
VASGSVSSASLESADGAFIGPAGPDSRVLRRRRHAQIMQAFVTASFCVDAFCMALLALCGAVPFKVPLVYALLFAACCSCFTLAVRSSPGKCFADPYLTMPQMFVASTIQFGFMLWAPQIGIPVLTGLFIIVGFTSLRLNLSQAGLASLWLTVGVSIVMGLRGEELSIPLATPVQRLISGLWISTVVARVIVLGQYGAQLRKTLIKRNDELNRTMEIAEHLASRDGLTGALNRGSILKAIDAERLRMSRKGTKFSIALLDLDHFKRINDGFGHLVGDQVLTLVVAQIAAQLRATDHLGRYGGEEFLLLLGDSGSESDVRQAVERILRAVEHHPWSQVAAGLAVTTSAGLASARREETVIQLLSRADDALYRAKNAGRNRICAG